MKVFLTGSNYRKLLHTGDNVLIHFIDNCTMLQLSNTGINEYELSQIPNSQQIYDGFLHDGKQIQCCSHCSPEKFPDVLKHALKVDAIQREQNLKERAKEHAISQLSQPK